MSDIDPALIAARAECAKRPADPEAWLGCAGLAQAAGDTVETAAGLFRAAELLARSGDLARAAPLCERVLELDPGHAAGRRLQAWLSGQLAPLPVRMAEGSGPVPTTPPEPLDPELANAMAATLVSSPLLRELTSDQVRYLQQSGTWIKFPAGSVVLGEGEEGTELFLVLRGRLVVQRAQRRLAELGPGALFGEMAALTGAPRSATVIAVADTEVLELAADTLRILIERAPRVAELLLRSCRARCIASLLVDSCWLTGLAVPAQRALVKKLLVYQLSPGDILIRPGERVAGLYYVALGRLERRRAADQPAWGTLGPGGEFGVAALRGNGISGEELRAAEPSWVLLLPEEEASPLLGRA